MSIAACAAPATVSTAVKVAALLCRATVVVAPHIAGVLDGHEVLRAGVVGAERFTALVHLAHTIVAFDLPSARDGREARGAADGVAKRWILCFGLFASRYLPPSRSAFVMSTGRGFIAHARRT